MIDAHSWISIRNHLLKDLQFESAQLINSDPQQLDPVQQESENTAYVKPLDGSSVHYSVDESFTSISEKKLTGILFCHPASALAKSEILPHLSYFHHRSEKHINLFCAGYGAHWPEDKYQDQSPVTEIAGVDWFFSDSILVSLIKELESHSKWKYSGEVELLLLDVTKIGVDDLHFSFDKAVVCNLEKMSKDGAFTSPRSFFEDIIRYTASKNGPSTTWEFSDHRGIKLAGRTLKDVVLSFLPSNLHAAYNQGSSYAVRNLENDSG